MTAARYAPSPMLIMPEMSSARPPMMTRRVLPREERPAVRAKGTVSPSEKPMMMSRRVSLRPSGADDEEEDDVDLEEQRPGETSRPWALRPVADRSERGSGSRGDVSEAYAMVTVCIVEWGIGKRRMGEARLAVAMMALEVSRVLFISCALALAERVMMDV